MSAVFLKTRSSPYPESMNLSIQASGWINNFHHDIQLAFQTYNEDSVLSTFPTVKPSCYTRLSKPDPDDTRLCKHRAD